MVGALTVLEESGEVGVSEVGRELRSLRNNVDVMIGITNDFLDIHAMVAGKLRLHAAWTDVRELLAEYVHARARSLGVYRSADPRARRRSTQLRKHVHARIACRAHGGRARARARAARPAPRAAGDLM